MTVLRSPHPPPRVSPADVASLLAALFTALGGVALLVLPLGTSVTSSGTPSGGVSTVVDSAPVATVGEALPLLVALVLAVAAPLFLRRTAAARPLRIVVAAIAVLGVLVTALSVGWLFLPAAICTVVAAAVSGWPTPRS